MKFKLRKEIKFFLISSVVSTILIFFGIASSDPGILGNTIILSTFILITPQLLIRYEKYRELKDMESKFPIFLRNLIESLRSGMSFHQSILASSKIEHGKLSPEIKKMANQVSWGIPLDKVLDQFAERVKKSRRLFLAIKIIRESYLSGGDVVSTLDSVASSTMMMEDSEKDRKSLFGQYVVLMYTLAFIFIGIVVAINRLMLPIFQITVEFGEFGLVNPCIDCIGAECSVCDVFQKTSQYVFIIDPTSIAAYYTSLFFFMSFIQSFFFGLIAGVISENSLSAGMKHSLILLGMTFGTFSILVRLGLMGV